jgi:inner membrane protein
MPSIGHVIVGLAAGRRYARPEASRLAPTAALVALATFPDLDFLWRRLGAVAGGPWAHRGALHSLPVALAAALLAAWGLGGLGRSRRALACWGFAVAASHGLLDTLTWGGAGVMLLWPLSSARWLAPVGLVAAAPMGLRLASGAGLAVVCRELLLFSPLLAYALWPRRWRLRMRGAP